MSYTVAQLLWLVANRQNLQASATEEDLDNEYYGNSGDEKLLFAYRLRELVDLRFRDGTRITKVSIDALAFGVRPPNYTRVMFTLTKESQVLEHT